LKPIAYDVPKLGHLKYHSNSLVLRFANKVT